MKHTYLRIMALAALFIAAQQAYAMHLKTVVTRFMPIMASAIKTNAPMVASAVRVAHNANQPVGLFNRFFCTTPIRKASDFTSKDPYKILDVKRGSSAQKIKEAYHKAVKENHPDTCKNLDAKANTQKINSAYATLTQQQDAIDTDDDDDDNDDLRAAASFHKTFYQKQSGSRQAAIDRSFAYGYSCEIPTNIYGNFSGKGPHYYEGGRVIAAGLRSFDRGAVDPDHVRGKITFRQFGTGYLEGEYVEVEYTRPKTDQDRAALANVEKILKEELPEIEKRRTAILEKWIEYGALDKDYNLIAFAPHNNFIDLETPSQPGGWYYFLGDRYKKDFVRTPDSIFKKFGTTIVNSASIDKYIKDHYGQSLAIMPDKAERADIIFGDVVYQGVIDDLIYHKQWKRLDDYVKEMIGRQKWKLEVGHEKQLKEYEAALKIHNQKQYEKMIDHMIGDSY